MARRRRTRVRGPRGVRTPSSGVQKDVSVQPIVERGPLGPATGEQPSPDDQDLFGRRSANIDEVKRVLRDLLLEDQVRFKSIEFTDIDNADLQDNWVRFASTQYAPGFQKDTVGYVNLRGTVRDGDAPASTIFTLPAGFRPKFNMNFPVVAGNGMARLRVGANGNVDVVAYISGGSNSFISLENIRFKADF